MFYELVVHVLSWTEEVHFFLKVENLDNSNFDGVLQK